MYYDISPNSRIFSLTVGLCDVNPFDACSSLDAIFDNQIAQRIEKQQVIYLSWIHLYGRWIVKWSAIYRLTLKINLVRRVLQSFRSWIWSSADLVICAISSEDIHWMAAIIFSSIYLRIASTSSNGNDISFSFQSFQ